MPSFISLNDAAEEGARLMNGPGGLFSRFQMALLAGRIAAHSSSGSIARVERRHYTDLSQGLMDHGFQNDSIMTVIADQLSGMGYRTYFGNEAYFTIISCVNGFDIVSQLQSEPKAGQEIMSWHWKWARHHHETDAIICDDLHFMRRSIFKGVSFSKTDLSKCGFGGNQIEKKKRGPKGFYNEIVEQFAFSLLVEQPDISWDMFEASVRDKLEREQKDKRWRYPGATAFREHYGKLWTANRGDR